MHSLGQFLHKVNEKIEADYGQPDSVIESLFLHKKLTTKDFHLLFNHLNIPYTEY